MEHSREELSTLLIARCGSDWKRSLQIALDYSLQLYFYIYNIYIYIYIINSFKLNANLLRCKNTFNMVTFNVRTLNAIKPLRLTKSLIPSPFFLYCLFTLSILIVSSFLPFFQVISIILYFYLFIQFSPNPNVNVHFSFEMQICFFFLFFFFNILSNRT